MKILIILDHFSKRPTNTPPNSIFEMCLFDQLRKYWESSFEWKSEILCFFLSIYSVWTALRVLRLHKLWCAADSSNSTVRTPWKFLMRIWWSPVKKLCEKWVVALSFKAQLLHPFCEMHRQVGVILLHFWKCLYREVFFFFWSEAKKAAFLKFFLKTLTSVSFFKFLLISCTENISPYGKKILFSDIFHTMFIKCSHTDSTHHHFFQQNFCNFIANSTFE